MASLISGAYFIQLYRIFEKKFLSKVVFVFKFLAQDYYSQSFREKKLCSISFWKKAFNDIWDFLVCFEIKNFFFLRENTLKLFLHSKRFQWFLETSNPLGIKEFFSFRSFEGSSETRYVEIFSHSPKKNFFLNSRKVEFNFRRVKKTIMKANRKRKF